MTDELVHYELTDTLVGSLAEAMGMHPDEWRAIQEMQRERPGETVSQQIGRAVAERALSA
jgi:hypothetical protein